MAYAETYVGGVGEEEIIGPGPTSAYTFMASTYAPPTPAMALNASAASAVDTTTNSNASLKGEQWLVDSGCSQHMTPCRADFVSYHKMDKSSDIYIANDAVIKAIGVGTVAFEAALPDGTAHTISLSNVLYAPDLSCGLVSNAQLTSDGARLVFEGDDCFVYDTRSGNPVLHATKARAQYPLNIVRTKSQLQAAMAVFYSSVKVNGETLHLWHRRTGHLNEQDLLRLADMSTGMELQKEAKKSGPLCSSCMTGKMRKKYLAVHKIQYLTKMSV